MIEFTITGEELWARMERAVEKVNERLRKTVRILEDAKVPYAVIGDHAVQAWVAQVDEAALRTTRDVDILVRLADLQAMTAAMTAAGFHYRKTTGLEMFVEQLDLAEGDSGNQGSGDSNEGDGTDEPSELEETGPLGAWHLSTPGTYRPLGAWHLSTQGEFGLFLYSLRATLSLISDTMQSGGFSMIEFTITGEELWARMERAVEKVNERLRKTVRILEDAKVPYAVIGGHAVRAWVAQVDEAALRTTRDVDILVRPADLQAMTAAMTAAGFHYRKTTGLDMFVEHPDGSARDAVHVMLVGNVERRGDEPNPDIEPTATANDFQTVALETLVRMKLNAYRRKDQVHLLDMISLGMIDKSWLGMYPQNLRLRLEELLNDPDG